MAIASSSATRPRQRLPQPRSQCPRRPRDERERLLFSWLLIATCATLALMITLQAGGDGGAVYRPHHSLLNVDPSSSSNGTLQRRRPMPMNSVTRFLAAYPQRFADFYAPKLGRLARWTHATLAALDLELDFDLKLSEDVSNALDFGVALVAVASVYHVIEGGRRALLRRLRQRQRIAAGVADAEDAGTAEREQKRRRGRRSERRHVADGTDKSGAAF